MPAIKNRKLSFLVKLLKEQAAGKQYVDHFDMQEWYSEHNSCGTSACAAGLYILKSRGKILRFDHQYVQGMSMPALTRKGHTIYGYPALTEHFKISRKATYMIFNPCYYLGFYPTPLAVAARIEQYLLKGKL